mmetsp:Transcript_68317/g.192649  ORF Transcript_68317/g.192649 Transcript_68317/m.192649 type:complete len:275 (-) Transcript_68317:200-1024(-)
MWSTLMHGCGCGRCWPSSRLASSAARGSVVEKRARTCSNPASSRCRFQRKFRSSPAERNPSPSTSMLWNCARMLPSTPPGQAAGPHGRRAAGSAQRRRGADGPSWSRGESSEAWNPRFRSTTVAMCGTTLSPWSLCTPAGVVTVYWSPLDPTTWPTMPFSPSGWTRPVILTKAPIVSSGSVGSAPTTKTRCFCPLNRQSPNCCAASSIAWATFMPAMSTETVATRPSCRITVSGLNRACAACAAPAAGIACHIACTHGPSLAARFWGSASSCRS